MTDDSAANADAGDPSHGNLLDFDPVPRKVKRPDGCTARRPGFALRPHVGRASQLPFHLPPAWRHAATSST